MERHITSRIHQTPSRCFAPARAQVMRMLCRAQPKCYRPNQLGLLGRTTALTTVPALGYALTAGTADEASLLSGLGTACASLAASLPATRNPNQLTQEKLYGQFAFPELPEAVHWFNPRELDWKMVLCVAGFAG